MRKPSPTAGALLSKKPPDEVKTLIRQEFRSWGLERDEYEIYPAHGGREARVEFWLNGKKQEMACSKSWEYAQNLHALWSIIQALRRAYQRGILEELASAAIAMLPPGDQHRDPYEVLGVRPDAPMSVIKASYRALSNAAHPDKGGSEGQMKELNDALEQVQKERGTA
jgi:hypothetical protein